MMGNVLGGGERPLSRSIISEVIESVNRSDRLSNGNTSYNTACSKEIGRTYLTPLPQRLYAILVTNAFYGTSLGGA
jgi:hypothetical protein